MLVLVVAAGAIPVLVQGETLSVEGDAMSPTFARGDLIVVRADEDPASIEAGEIITFRTGGPSSAVETRRVIGEATEGPGHEFVTTSDAGESVNEKKVAESQIVGVYMYRIPKLGYAVSWMGDNTFALIVAACVVILLAGVIMLIAARRGTVRSSGSPRQAWSPGDLLARIRRPGGGQSAEAAPGLAPDHAKAEDASPDQQKGATAGSGQRRRVAAAGWQLAASAGPVRLSDSDAAAASDAPGRGDAGRGEVDPEGDDLGEGAALDETSRGDSGDEEPVATLAAPRRATPAVIEADLVDTLTDIGDGPTLAPVPAEETLDEAPDEVLDEVLDEAPEKEAVEDLEPDGSLEDEPAAEGPAEGDLEEASGETPAEEEAPDRAASPARVSTKTPVRQREDAPAKAAAKAPANVAKVPTKPRQEAAGQADPSVGSSSRPLTRRAAAARSRSSSDTGEYVPSGPAMEGRSSGRLPVRKPRRIAESSSVAGLIPRASVRAGANGEPSTVRVIPPPQTAGSLGARIPRAKIPPNPGPELPAVHIERAQPFGRGRTAPASPEPSAAPAGSGPHFGALKQKAAQAMHESGQMMPTRRSNRQAATRAAGTAGSTDPAPWLEALDSRRAAHRR
jgi:signal peptidase